MLPVRTFAPLSGHPTICSAPAPAPARVRRFGGTEMAALGPLYAEAVQVGIDRRSRGLDFAADRPGTAGLRLRLSLFHPPSHRAGCELDSSCCYRVAPRLSHHLLSANWRRRTLQAPATRLVASA